MVEVVPDELPKVKSRLEGGGYLPPIQRLVMPQTVTQSALVRWLWALGYSVKDIHHGTGIRYQQVRNMVTSQPKRATREDLPPLEIKVMEPEDAVQLIMDQALDASVMAGRSAERKGAAKARRAKGKTPDDEGNEDLDDENYNRY